MPKVNTTGLTDEEALEMIKAVNEQPACMVEGEHINKAILKATTWYWSEFIQSLIENDYEVKIKINHSTGDYEITWGDKA